MTNDGDFANQMMHPRYHIPKCYRVTVRPDMNDEQAMRLAEGVELDGRRTAPAQVTVLSKEPGRVVVQIVITEGRNRQIRRMCEAVGLEVAGSAWHAAAGKMADADPAGTVSAAVCDTQRPGHG